MQQISHPFSRAAAWELLTVWTQSESLRKHALAVETCVAACGEAEANRLGLTGDARAAMVELYSTTALLHDFDYERHPSREEHPFVGVAYLRESLVAPSAHIVPGYESVTVTTEVVVWPTCME